MKKRISVLLAAIIFIFNLSGGYTALAATINMPITGWPLSFWQKPDTGADLTEGGTGVEVTNDASWVQNGYGALHIWVEKSIANLNAQAVQRIEAFAEGKDFRLTGKIYISENNWGFGLYLGNTRLTMLRNIVTPGQWSDLDYTFTFTGTSKDFKIQVAQIGHLYADDLSLKEVIYDGASIVGYGEELLENGDFEADFVPAGEVKALAAVAGDGMVQLSWVNPQSQNLDKILVFSNGDLLKEVDKTENSVIIDGLENGVDYVFTVKTKTNFGVLSEGVAVSARPSKKLPLPKVIKDDEDNRIVGLTEEMEYSFDEGKTWTLYDGNTVLDLSGNVTIWIRMHSSEVGVEAPVQVLNFTENASGDDEINIERAAIKGNTFYLNGRLNEKEQATVTFLIVRKGHSRRDLSAIIAVGEGKSDKDGRFSFEIPIADSRGEIPNDGEYTLYVDSSITDDVAFDGLIFVNSATRGEALSKLFTEPNIGELLEKGSTYYNAYLSMGMPLAEYHEDSVNRAKTISDFKVLLGKVDQTADNAQEMAAEAFIEAYLMNAMEAANADKAYLLLKKYGAQLDLRYSESVAWSNLEQAAPGAVAWTVMYMAGKSYDQTNSLNKRFCESYALYLINNATYGNIASVIAGQKQILGLSGSAYDRYMAMEHGSDKQVEASKKIVLSKYLNPFTDGSDVLKAIQAALSATDGPGSPGGPGGGGGLDRKSPGINTNTLSMVGQPTVQLPDEMPAEEVFSDLKEVPWAKESIIYLYGKGIVKGYGNGEFRPQNPVTREELVSILVSAFGLMDSNAEAEFDDVLKEQWYYKAVASAASAGVVGGMGDGRFGIGENITREDLAVMAYRCLALNNTDITGEPNGLGFTDREQISEYAKEAVSAMNKLGIISGYSDGSLKPKNNATRAEAAKIIHAVLKLEVGM